MKVESVIAPGIYRMDNGSFRVVARVGDRKTGPRPKEKRFPKGTALRGMQAWQSDTRASLRRESLRPVKGTLADGVERYLVLPEVKALVAYKDRVREISADNQSKASFAARVDQANNESFSRTIVIAFLVTLSIVVVVLFGGTSIRDMNVALLIGSIAGTWSTIALACPFVVWWNNRRIRPKNA